MLVVEGVEAEEKEGKSFGLQDVFDSDFGL